MPSLISIKYMEQKEEQTDDIEQYLEPLRNIVMKDESFEVIRERVRKAAGEQKTSFPIAEIFASLSESDILFVA